jgi:hypothetical protein
MVRIDPADGSPPHTEIMSAQREELLRLVEELPEEEVPAVLDDVRRHLRAVKNRSWPPAWFGAAKGRSTDVAARSATPPPPRFLPPGGEDCREPA